MALIKVSSKKELEIFKQKYIDLGWDVTEHNYLFSFTNWAEKINEQVIIFKYELFPNAIEYDLEYLSEGLFLFLFREFKSKYKLFEHKYNAYNLGFCFYDVNDNSIKSFLLERRIFKDEEEKFKEILNLPKVSIDKTFCKDCCKIS